MRPHRNAYTPDPEAARVRRTEAFARLEAGVESVTTDEGFRAWLRAASRFHKYSFGNQLLIAFQRPDATRVAGFRAWQDLGRHVVKGAKGIQILVPHVRKVTEDADEAETETETRAAVSFGVGYVFDVSDTDGEPLPALDYQHTEGDTAHELWGRIEAVAQAHGWRITSDERMIAASGYFDIRTSAIWHQPALSLDGRASTVLHEMAHALDYDAHRDRAESFDYRAHRGERETVAEAVAYVAADHFGLDTGTETFAYVASWARDKATLKARMGEIQTLSDRLITQLEAAEVRERLAA
jgi:antirestriction protein ArdC